MNTPQQIIQTETNDYHFMGIRALLTYPQCNDGTKEELLTFLKTIYANKIDYIVVCKEHHDQTDGEHYHAYIKLNVRTRINANNLVYRNIRPNLERVKSTAWKAVEYVKKHGDFIEEGTCTDIHKLTTQEKYKLIKEKTYIQIFEMATLSLPELCKVKQIQRELIVNNVFHTIDPFLISSKITPFSPLYGSKNVLKSPVKLTQFSSYFCIIILVASLVLPVPVAP